MNIFLWIAQGPLAIAFISGGFGKMLQPKEKLAPKYGWVNDFSSTSVKLIGLAEVAGGTGLIIPELTGIMPILTPIAAAALGILMLGAVVTHLRRNERSHALVPSILFLLLLFVAHGRFTQ